jgi:peptidoglycan hydrolase CwlO-like protein
MPARKTVNRDSIARDWHFWTTVGMFVAAILLIVSTVFLVMGTKQLNDMTQSYSETFVETAEDMSASAADIQEAVADLSQFGSYLEDITDYLESIDDNLTETMAVVAGMESALDDVGDATLEALDAIAALKVDINRVLSSFEYMTYYWCHYCCTCD